MADKGQELRDKLTIYQIRFCAGIVEGLSGAAAIAQCGSKAKSVYTRSAMARRWLDRPEVAEYIAYLKVNIESDCTLSRQRKREILKKIAENFPEDRASAIQAIKTDNAMTGDDAPVRMEGELTLSSIFQALQQQGSTGLPSPEERRGKVVAFGNG